MFLMSIVQMDNFLVVPVLHSMSNMIKINKNYHDHKNKRILYRRKYHHIAHTTFEFISFIHSIGMCRTRRFRAILRSFLHSSLLCVFSCHPSPTILPSSLTSSCHLFLGLPLNLVPKFIYNTVLGIIFSSILCTCPNQRNLFNLIVFVIVGF